MPPRSVDDAEKFEDLSVQAIADLHGPKKWWDDDIDVVLHEDVALQAVVECGIGFSGQADPIESMSGPTTNFWAAFITAVGSCNMIAEYGEVQTMSPDTIMDLHERATSLGERAVEYTQGFGNHATLLRYQVGGHLPVPLPDADQLYLLAINSYRFE